MDSSRWGKKLFLNFKYNWFLARHFKIGFLVVLLSFFVGTVSTPTQVQASGEAIQASYQWLSTTDQYNGDFLVSYSFTVKNTGSIDFLDLNIRVRPTTSSYSTDSEMVFPVGFLPVGQSVTFNQTIKFLMPVDNQMALAFLGEAQEADGSGASFQIAIEKEVTL